MGVKKRILSFKYAGQGVINLFRKEPNASIHALATIAVVIAGVVLEISRNEWIAVILCIGGVFTAEAINSAIERVVDLVSPEYNELAGNAKDLAAAAVLIFSITAAIVGLIIFIPKLLLLYLL